VKRHPSSKSGARDIFWPVFSHVSEKLVAIGPPIFSGHKYFFLAYFVLFSQKIGHLATADFSRGRQPIGEQLLLSSFII
jgi:hypothetical protein